MVSQMPTPHPHCQSLSQPKLKTELERHKNVTFFLPGGRKHPHCSSHFYTQATESNRGNNIINLPSICVECGFILLKKNNYNFNLIDNWYFHIWEAFVRLFVLTIEQTLCVQRSRKWRNNHPPMVDTTVPTK